MDGGSDTVTSEKGICGKFGRSDELRGNMIGSAEVSGANRKGSSERKMIWHASFSEDIDRSKGGANEDVKFRRKRMSPPLAIACCRTISMGSGSRGQHTWNDRRRSEERSDDRDKVLWGYWKRARSNRSEHHFFNEIEWLNRSQHLAQYKAFYMFL
jgi:hypothetical protein